MRHRSITTLIGATIAAAVAGPASAAGPPIGGCPPGFTLTVVDAEAPPAVAADKNGDGLICVTGDKETPQFTFRIPIDNVVGP